MPTLETFMIWSPTGFCAALSWSRVSCGKRGGFPAAGAFMVFSGRFLFARKIYMKCRSGDSRNASRNQRARPDKRNTKIRTSATAL